MKIATFHPPEGDSRLGCVVGRDVIDITATGEGSGDVAPGDMPLLSSVMSLLSGGPRALEVCRRIMTSPSASTVRYACEDVQFAAPIPAPKQVIAVGRNYAEHAEEAGIETGVYPRLFPKWPSTVIGAGAPIIKPPLTSELDWEVELGVVISRPTSRVAVECALDHVFGYTLVNDVSARDIQFSKPEQLTLGKNFRTFAPMGSWIVTADEVPDPGDIALKCWINHTLMQDGHTREMITGVASLIAFISEVVDLEPGDVISTGTPAGVGCFQDPPVYLEDGDEIRMEMLVDGQVVCSLANPVLDHAHVQHEKEVTV